MNIVISLSPLRFQKIFDVVIRLSIMLATVESGNPEYVLKCPKENPPSSLPLLDS